MGASTSSCCASGSPCCTNKGNDHSSLDAEMRPEPKIAPGLALGTKLDFMADAPRGSSGSQQVSEPEPAKRQEDIVTYPDGSKYQGQTLNGLKDGFGRLWSDTEYQGEWKADMQHGKGKQTWPDGRVYEGQYDSGRFSGRGRMEWKKEDGKLVYDGEYKDDQKHGHGKFTWANGRTYEGEWNCGKRHGRGIVQNQQGQRRACYYNEDKFERWEESDPNARGAGHAP